MTRDNCKKIIINSRKSAHSLSTFSENPLSDDKDVKDLCVLLSSPLKNTYLCDNWPDKFKKRLESLSKPLTEVMKLP
ncbi:hypothetical protein [Desulfosediminicola sp.]|uniref:hypothetical protein n=1 Tax=Desulfosediminicola sp. TaxID=2886825 RepID=UPI003AF2B903